MNLSRVRALVTRPQPQAQSLAQAIEAADGQAWVMPMLAINPLPETQAIKDRLLMLDRFDLVIVTSAPWSGFDRPLLATVAAPSALVRHRQWDRR